MPKEKTRYNEPALWERYRASLIDYGQPKTDKQAMAVIDPTFAVREREMAEKFGLPLSKERPFNGDMLGETGVPIARANTAFRKATATKTAVAKLRHLRTAEWWLVRPHPWQGPKNQKRVASLLKKVQAEIVKQEGKVPV